MELPNLGFNPKLMKVIFQNHKLHPNSLHGPDHWLRVGQIGLALAEKTKANKNIVKYFAQLHDVGRIDDSHDDEHGIRSAAFCTKYRKLIQLTNDEMVVLIDAIAYHPLGKTSKDRTIGTCWDADRLDLPRVGTLPDHIYLSTREAKEDEFFAWATTLYQAPVMG